MPSWFGRLSALVVNTIRAFIRMNTQQTSWDVQTTCTKSSYQSEKSGIWGNRKPRIEGDLRLWSVGQVTGVFTGTVEAPTMSEAKRTFRKSARKPIPGNPNKGRKVKGRKARARMDRAGVCFRRHVIGG